jgi:hypothetical protein
MKISLQNQIQYLVTVNSEFKNRIECFDLKASNVSYPHLSFQDERLDLIFFRYQLRALQPSMLTLHCYHLSTMAVMDLILHLKTNKHLKKFSVNSEMFLQLGTQLLEALSHSAARLEVLSLRHAILNSENLPLFMQICQRMPLKQLDLEYMKFQISKDEAKLLGETLGRCARLEILNAESVDFNTKEAQNVFYQGLVQSHSLITVINGNFLRLDKDIPDVLRETLKQNRVNLSTLSVGTFLSTRLCHPEQSKESFSCDNDSSLSLRMTT